MNTMPVFMIIPGSNSNQGLIKFEKELQSMVKNKSTNEAVYCFFILINDSELEYPRMDSYKHLSTTQWFFHLLNKLYWGKISTAFVM